MQPSNQNTILLKKVAKEQLEHAIIISALKNDVADLKLGMNRVLYLLENDNKTNSKGLVEQVKLNTLFRQDLKTKVTILGIVGGGMFWAFTLVLKLIFKQ